MKPKTLHKILLLLLVTGIPLLAVPQEFNIKSGVHFINNGTNLILNNADVVNTGTIQNRSNGFIALTGDWLNDGTYSAQPASTVLFHGSSSQEIGGTAPTAFNNLTLDNAEGAVMGNSQSVNGTLTLANGLLTLGDHNLTLGEAAVAGTPGTSSMIVATGTGECRRIFTANGAYTFPVGDATGIAEYSPITLEFTSGTYADAYAGVRVINSKHPNNASSVNYLNRYWSVGSSGITDFNCNVTANYVQADIAGAESAQAAGKYSGTLPWTKYSALASNTLSASNVSSLSDFTGITLAPPTVAVTVDPGLSVCPGTPLTLTANPAGDPAILYLWSPGGGTAPSINPSTATPGSTLYSVQVTDGNGFTGSTGVTVEVISRTLSGTLKYNNAAKTPMNNVTLTLSNGATSTTNSAGQFSFGGLCDGTYTVSVTNNPKAPGSINATDAAQVNYWGINHYNIEYVRFLAGDVYGNEFVPNYEINSTDASHIQLRFVNGPGYIFPRDSWSYWKAGTMVGNNGNLGNISVNISSTNNTQNLYGQVTGDFNGSYIWSPLKSMMSGITLLYDEPVLVEKNTEATIPVRVVEAADLTAASMVFVLPDGLVDILDVTMKDLPGRLDWTVYGDELRIGWNSAVAQSFSAGEELVSIRLRTTDNFISGSTVRMELTPDPVNELADGNFRTIPDAILQISTLEANSTGLENGTGNTEHGTWNISCRPNPFKDITRISYTVPIAGRVTLYLTNMLGQDAGTLVDTWQDKGDYAHNLNAEHLFSGIYTLTMKVDTGKEEMVKVIKLVVNRNR